MFALPLSVPSRHPNTTLTDDPRRGVRMFRPRPFTRSVYEVWTVHREDEV